MSKENERRIWLHRFAVFTASCTFLLVIAGGLVTSTGSGLSVPDWPLSYGQFMPPMVGGIVYEHTHRLIATFVGMLTVVLAVWLWRTEDRRWVKMLGLTALAAVIIQGALGGLTVLLLLPTPISVLHATLAQSFFSLVTVIALVTSEWWRNRQPVAHPSAPRTRRLAMFAAGVILMQLVLGAWMRHSDAGLAIPDFPLSYGHVLPPLDSNDLADANEIRADLNLPPVAMGQAWIHFAHRIGALLACVVVLTFVLHVLKTYKEERELREPALMLGAIILFQAVLGALTVWTGKGVEIATIHVATGALTLALSVFTLAKVYRLFALAERRAAFFPVPSPMRP